MATNTKVKDFKINQLTEKQYNEAKANNIINENELYLTTDDSVSGGSSSPNNKTTIYSDKLLGGKSITLSNVKRFLDVYAVVHYSQIIKYTIDTKLDNMEGSKSFGSSMGVCWDSSNSNEYYVSESSYNVNNNVFTHEKIGYIAISSGVYANRNGGSDYYVYRIDTYD